ncbi:unnamed protein product, partial [Mesorhabditis belari]|uniref:Uncharacterized protein n=1 Tax=Mesorhabditis belari TaxID=2138241 RepID=A0AAF3EXT8_9BILA
MVKLPLPLPNLRNSPIVKLCYDLKLEILQRMDPKDVIELMKNNATLLRRNCRGCLISVLKFPLQKMISEMLECLASVQEIRPVKDYEALCKYLLIFKGSIVS